MARSKSKSEDTERLKGAQDRVSKEHGGVLVEAVAPEDLESFNDANCKHENLVRDPTETEWNAFTCANEKCNEVVLFDKT